MVYNTNAFLTTPEQQVNADYIYNYLSPKGWSKNAIAGMLGNMQTESTINFGIWENLDSTNPANGFGLVQWTPSTKYTDWASANHYTDNTVGELERLIYEVTNGIQWIADGHYQRYGLSHAYNYSFSTFITSTDTPENLANAWMWNYEGPANPDQPNRATQARTWYTYIGGGSPPPPPPSNQNDLITLYLADVLPWN
jgi:hypothetical protein